MANAHDDDELHEAEQLLDTIEIQVEVVEDLQTLAIEDYNRMAKPSATSG
jgi:hypothetical protein